MIKSLPLVPGAASSLLFFRTVGFPLQFLFDFTFIFKRSDATRTSKTESKFCSRFRNNGTIIDVERTNKNEWIDIAIITQSQFFTRNLFLVPRLVRLKDGFRLHR